MPWQILNMADTTSCPDLFASLAPMANVVSLPPRRETLLERIAGFDAYFASLHVRLDREALDKTNRLRVIATASTEAERLSAVSFNASETGT